MNRKKWIILITVLVSITAGVIFALRYTFQSSEISVEKEAADIVVTASELMADFEENEQEANTKYLNKIITVTGRVDNLVEDDTYYTVTLKAEEDYSGILCSFDKTTLEKEAFTEGSIISVKGICTGFLLDVVLTKCSLVE